MATPGTGKPRKKRIPIEHYDRVRVMMISMLPYSEIEKQCGNSWGKNRSYVRSVISAVHADWEEGAASVVNTRRHQIREGFEYLYQKAVGDKDWAVAARVLTELGRLDGCYMPDKVAVHHQGQVGVGLALGSLGFKSPQEVAERVEWLKAQIAAKGPQALGPGQAQLVAQAHLNGEIPDNQTTGVPLPPSTTIIDTSSTEGDDQGGVS